MTITEVERTFDRDDGKFWERAQSVIRFQREHNSIYSNYCRAYDRAPDDLGPYLPVEAFKLAPVAAFQPDTAEAVFESSGTSQVNRSRHYIRRLDVYRRAAVVHFRRTFGDGPFVLLAHLPAYTEQGDHSSLVTMLHFLIGDFGSEYSGFFLQNHQALEKGIERSSETGIPMLLFGAAFGLLDILEGGPIRLPGTAMVIETGGMKTHRREIKRTELHEKLSEGFGIDRSRIRSEYGMCEMLSQFYTSERQIFVPPHWLRTTVVDPGRPYVKVPDGETGLLAVFDLANMYSVSAILTDDMARKTDEGIEILGRARGAQLRGCNFLVEQYL